MLILPGLYGTALVLQNRKNLRAVGKAGGEELLLGMKTPGTCGTFGSF